MDAEHFFEKLLHFFFEDSTLQDFEDKLLMNGSRMKNLKGYIRLSVIEGIFAMAGAMVLAWQAKLPDLYIIAAGLAFFLPFGANYLFQDVLFERKKREKEALLPDLLLEASVFCDETSFINIIKRISAEDFPGFGKDFRRAHTEISNGSGVEEAMKRMRRLNKSRLFSSAVTLLLHAYKTGSKMSSLFKEVAENILEMQAVVRERAAVMLINKYTLIFSAGLIVPAVLGLIVGLVSGMNFGAMEEVGLGMSAEERIRMLELASLGTNIYIGEYALVSAFFLAVQEGNKKNFWIYALMLLPTSLAIFHFAKIL